MGQLFGDKGEYGDELDSKNLQYSQLPEQADQYQDDSLQMIPEQQSMMTGSQSSRAAPYSAHRPKDLS